MAPPHVFAIEVENGDKPFYPGQHISGKVILQCQEKKKLRGIYLTLKGRAYVHWTESRSEGDVRQRTDHYIAREQYFNHRINLWKGKDGDSDGEEYIQPGNYEWPFSFDLPSVPLPSSLESQCGNVRYCLEARMDRPWKFDHVTKFAFTILERVDLNLSGVNLILPCRGAGQKTLGCLCWASDPLTLTASTDRKGYCSGEQILVTAHLENNTNKEMKMLKATLRRKVTLYARGESREFKTKVSQMQTDSLIPAGQTFDWNQQPLLIPEACPPSSHTSQIIHTEYLLDVEVVVPTFSINLHVVLPITIGTVPLGSVQGNSPPPYPN